MASLLELRRSIKSRKPSFIRQDAHKRQRLSKVWRLPKGVHSKMRHRIKGYRRSVEPGWGSPKAVKHLHSSGLMPVLVSSPKELAQLDKAKHGAIISSSVGQKNRAAIVTEAVSLGLKLINIKDAGSFLKKVGDVMAARKKEKAAIATEKDSKAKEKLKKAEEKQAKDELTEKIEGEEKKEQEKKEMEKLLTKRE